MKPEDHPFFFTWSVQRSARALEMVGGEGVWFDTADGRRWLDMAALVYQANLGHGCERVINAVKRQADALCLSVPSGLFPAKLELAERLIELAPEGFSKVFFTLGGAEAVENAIKMARMVTGRYKLISRYRSYHGATMGALSLSGDYRRPPLEPGLVGVVHALDCYCDRCPFGQVVERCQRECATHIGDLLRLEGAGSVAAVVLESIPGANGVLVPPPGYWSRVREACDADGALLVADEVLTGFGRTGRCFAFEHEGVVPDMITCGKALTGGYGTLGAVLVHDRVARHFDDNFLYAGLTHYGHPLGVASALAALEVYESDGLFDHAASLESAFLAGLVRCAARSGRAAFVRGRGLLGGIELDGEQVDSAFYARLDAALDANQVYIHTRYRDHMLIVTPPLCISEQELAEGMNRIGNALEEAAAG